MRQGTLSAFIYKRTQQYLQVNKIHTYVAANALHYFERITETCKTKSSSDAEKFQACAILLSQLVLHSSTFQESYALQMAPHVCRSKSLEHPLCCY